MVEEQLVARGIHDERVLEAMVEVPRDLFVPDHLRELAYEDRPLPIGCEQSISQPYVVALMLQSLALEGTETVLDIGTGSGYAAALLSCLAREVYSVERLPALASEARERLRRLGYSVHVRCADGTLGLPAHAPYAAIAVAASSRIVPPALTDQLALGGRMVIPVCEGQSETLLEIRRLARSDFHITRLQNVRFVPLIGEQGEH